MIGKIMQNIQFYLSYCKFKKDSIEYLKITIYYKMLSIRIVHIFFCFTV